MNKLELIETLKTKAELTKNEATAVVNLFFNEMANALASGDRVEIRGLCSFYVKNYQQINRLAINPLFQFFPAFKKWQLLRLNLDFLSGLWVPSGV